MLGDGGDMRVVVEGERAAVPALARHGAEPEEADIRVGGDGLHLFDVVVALGIAKVRNLVGGHAVLGPFCPSTEGGEGRGLPSWVDAPGALAPDGGIIGLRSEHGHPEAFLSPEILVKRQHVVLVLEQNVRVGSDGPGSLEVVVRSDVVVNGLSCPFVFAEVKCPDADEGAENALDGLVYLADVGVLEVVKVHVVGVGHLLIEALQERGGVRGAPVGHDVALETHVPF
mmetsp:Transcript_21196/g.44229  ORF Transcript_21196/g.44229 Transcript_21196/m.44229 type:complete len:228 (+) Transcript_21196:769-1452(+)